MELDSYGISSYFTGNVKDIQIDVIQVINVRNLEFQTIYGTFSLDKKVGDGSYGTLVTLKPQICIIENVLTGIYEP